MSSRSPRSEYAGTLMKSAVLTVVDRVYEALGTLEAAVDKQLSKDLKVKKEPQLELSRNEREVNRKIAAKLDQTINRLEMLLTEE
jgi:hypothetical protein